MSLLNKVTAPLKFAENEFESVVDSLYSIYNRKTGNDQYTLANFYADGGVAYLSTAAFLEKGLSILSVGVAGAGGYWLHAFHRDNKIARSLDEELSKSSETIKNPRREIMRGMYKNMGRVFLILGANSLVHQTFGYSIFDLMGSEQTRPAIENYFCTFGTFLFSLSGYTSAIDINNPKKSRLVPMLRKKLPKSSKGIDGLPQENFTLIPQP